MNFVSFKSWIALQESISPALHLSNHEGGAVIFDAIPLLTLFIPHRPSFVSRPWLLPPLLPLNCWEDVAFLEAMALWEGMALLAMV